MTYELLTPESARGTSRSDLPGLVDTAALDVREVGDGNLNLVFVCQDAAGAGLC